jgi:hypothetical protein
VESVAEVEVQNRHPAFFADQRFHPAGDGVHGDRNKTRFLAPLQDNFHDGYREDYAQGAHRLDDNLQGVLVPCILDLLEIIGFGRLQAGN